MLCSKAVESFMLTSVCRATLATLQLEGKEDRCMPLWE